MKKVWYFNMFDQPMNKAGDWLWNWQNLYEEAGSLKSAFEIAQKTKEINCHDEEKFWRLVTAYFYTCYETAKKPEKKTIIKLAKKHFGGLAKFGIDSLEKFIRLICKPKIKEVLNKKDYVKFSLWLKGVLK